MQQNATGIWGELYDALTLEPSVEDSATVIGTETEPVLLRQMQKLNNVEQADFGIQRKRLFRLKRGTVLMACVFVLILLSAGVWWLGWRKLEWGRVDTDFTGAGKVESRQMVERILPEKGDEEENPKICSMPNVIGKTEQEAKSEIVAADGIIEVRITRSYSDTVAYGIVMEQNVAPRTQYNIGAITEVVLVVSNGRRPEKTAPAENRYDASTEAYTVESDGNEPVDFYLEN